MKALIIYVSIHHGNTKKIAQAMAETLHAELLQPRDVDVTALAGYDLIGFGAGIYFGKHHKSLVQFVDSLPVLNTKAFIFSTRGSSRLGSAHRLLKDKLKSKGFRIVGEYSCRGFDTFGLLKLVGGVAKGRPNENDMSEARAFTTTLIVD